MSLSTPFHGRVILDIFINAMKAYFEKQFKNKTVFKGQKKEEFLNDILNVYASHIEVEVRLRVCRFLKMILVRNRVKNIFESHMMGFIRGRDASRMKIFFEIGNIFNSDTFTESDLMEPKTRKSIEQNKVNKLYSLLLECVFQFV